jgi:hypothetical protein
LECDSEREYPIDRRPCSRGITIENIYPTIDGGPFAVERIDGEPVDVWANILRDGNAVLTAELLWAIENLITGERITTEWGGVRLRIDPEHDPALLFRCLA